MAALLAACATPLPTPIVGYTCCNLRDHSGWVSSNNVQGGGLVPAGEPIRVMSIKREYYAYGEIGGAEFGLRHDQGKSREDTLAWLRTIAVAEDPNGVIASWPRPVRDAIVAGKVVPGMTRQQVLVALGHPARSDTPDLSAPVWRYWIAINDETVDLQFDEQGALSQVVGSPTSVRVVQMPS